MKKLILFFLLATVSVLNAQMTTVTATVTDSDSTLWTYGTWSIKFVPNPNNPNISVYNIGGTPLSPSVINQSGPLGSGGALSVSVYQNVSITPVGSSWTLQVCPNAVTACGSFNFTAAGSTMDLSSTLTTVIPVPRFHAISGTFGYMDAEAILQLAAGNTYWNVEDGTQHCYNNVTTAWGQCGSGGGGGSCSPTGPGIFATFWDGTHCIPEYIDYDGSSVLTVGDNTNTSGGIGQTNIFAGPLGGYIDIDPTVGETDIGTTDIYGKNEDHAVNVISNGQSNILANPLTICGYSTEVSDSCAGQGFPVGTAYSYDELNMQDGTDIFANGEQLGTFWQTLGEDIACNATGSPYTYGADTTNFFQPCDTVGGNIIINLPQITSVGFPTGVRYHIIKEDSSSNTITVNSFAGENINGNASITLSSQYQDALLTATFPQQNGDEAGPAFWSLQSGGSGSTYTGTAPIVVTGTNISCPTCSVGTGTSLTVNGGSSLGSANLNSTTPAPPSNHSNCAWQVSGSNISCNYPTLNLANVAALGTLSNSTTGNAQTATSALALASSPTQCPSTEYTTGVSATGNANCAVLSANMVTAINSVTGAFTFTGPGVSCTSTTCTFTGSSSGIGSITWSLPSYMSASPTTLSASGTQIFSFNVENANTFFRGPTSGSAAAPNWGVLVSADIPNNAANTTGTAANITASSNSTLTALPNLTTVSGGSFGSAAFTASSSYDIAGAAAARAGTGSCTSGQYSHAATTSGPTCAQVAYSQLSGTPTVISKIQLVIASATYAANGTTGDCATNTVTMTGLVLPSGTTPGSSVFPIYEGDPYSLAGWGRTSYMKLYLWVSAANTLGWRVCNQASSSETPSTLTIDIGAQQ